MKQIRQLWYLFVSGRSNAGSYDYHELYGNEAWNRCKNCYFNGLTIIVEVNAYEYVCINWRHFERGLLSLFDT